MTEELKEMILEMVPTYPRNNDNLEKEKGYHEAVDNFLEVFDNLIEKNK